MKTEKRVHVNFAFYDRSGIQKYLEEQAGKGWLFEGFEFPGCKFRRILPRKIHFAVTYFYESAQSKEQPTEEELLFREFCAHAGWKLAASNGKMQVFCSTAQDPVPIETDVSVEIKNIHRCLKRYRVMNTILISAMLMQVLKLVLGFVMIPFELLLDPWALSVAVWWLIVGLNALLDNVGYYCWYIKAKYAAQREGTFYPAGRTWQMLRKAFFFCVLATGILLLILDYKMIVLVGICFFLTAGQNYPIHGGFQAFLDSLWEKGGNLRWKITGWILVTIYAVSVLYCGIVLLKSSVEDGAVNGADERISSTDHIEADMHLLISDWGGKENAAFMYEWNTAKTVFMEQQESNQTMENLGGGRIEIKYIWTEVKADALYSWCIRSLLKNPDQRDALPGTVYTEIDAQPWGAHTAYHRSVMIWEDVWLLCYDDCFVELYFAGEPTDTQKALVGEKLGNG